MKLYLALLIACACRTAVTAIWPVPIAWQGGLTTTHKSDTCQAGTTEPYGEWTVNWAGVDPTTTEGSSLALSESCRVISTDRLGTLQADLGY